MIRGDGAWTGRAARPARLGGRPPRSARSRDPDRDFVKILTLRGRVSTLR